MQPHELVLNHLESASFANRVRDKFGYLDLPNRLILLALKSQG
jgi:hypothetical protein